MHSVSWASGVRGKPTVCEDQHPARRLFRSKVLRLDIGFYAVDFCLLDLDDHRAAAAIIGTIHELSERGIFDDHNAGLTNAAFDRDIAATADETRQHAIEDHRQDEAHRSR